MNPERVELVRLRLGLTEVDRIAAALGVDRKAVQRFETGEAELPDASIERLLSLSGYPRAFFDKGTPEYPSSKGVSFRSLRSLTAGYRNAAMAAGALAFELDDWVSSQYERPTQSIPQQRYTSPAEAAAYLRAQWGIGSRPIGNMINQLESRGVRVFSLVEETRHLDAYSLWRNDTPYIFLNTLKTAERSRFDAAHELAHLVLHRHSGSSHISAESEADAFAAAFLMPPEDVKAELPAVRSLKDILESKGRWGVSAAALAYTLNKMGKVSDWHYRGYCIELGRYGRSFEPKAIAPETSQVWTKVLTDLWSRGVSLSRIADRLAIPEKELGSLLFGIAAPIGRPTERTKPTLIK